jgi:SRSO17 transposase
MTLRDSDVSEDIGERFERYVQRLAPAFGHADRIQPADWYLKGLLSDLPRKSVEPMAALVHREDVRKAHQSMHHLVAEADWDDAEVLAAVAEMVVPRLVTGIKERYWIIDDTAHAKKGTKSVGVARQHNGRLGKEDNCQAAVSLSIASDRGSIPLGYCLYLGREWTDNRERCQKAGVPDDVEFQTKGQIARALITAALNRGVPRGVLLGDASYGVESDFRDWAREQKFDYSLAVRSNTAVWWGRYQPASPPPPTPGHPRTRLIRDETHQPISVEELARLLPPESWQSIGWREGTNGALRSRFARERVRAANENLPREEEWLLIEWPEGAAEPAHYWLATFPETMRFEDLVRHTMGRWRIERDYQEMKSELGLSHYEGRGWRGFHHHATLCIAAYGFLILEGLDAKKNSVLDLDYKNLPYPSASAQGAHGRMQRHIPWSIPTARRNFAAMLHSLTEQTQTYSAAA